MGRSGILVMPFVGAALICIGCQTTPLKIKDYKLGGEGAPYALRFTQFETKIVWRVVACGRTTPKNGQDPNEIPNKPFAVRAEVASEASYPEDPKSRWLIDLTSLDGWFNTSDLSVNYEGGKFKSFSAATEDKTAESISGIATTAAQIAAIALVANSKGDACADNVAAVEGSTSAVKKGTEKLEKAKQFLAAANAAGSTGESLRRAQGQLAQAILTLATDTAELEKAMKTVTYSQTVRWPQSGLDSQATEIHIPLEAITQWKAERWKEDIGDIAVALALLVQQADGTTLPPASENGTEFADKIAAGRIPLRMPKPGYLVATLKGEADKEILRKDATIIQSGDLLYIPVERKGMRSTTSGFSVDNNGYLTSVFHKQGSAPGQTLAKSAQAVAEQAKPFFKSDLDKLKAENDLLQARKTNAELRAALNPKPDSAEVVELKALSSELALKTAKIELMLASRWTAALGGLED